MAEYSIFVRPDLLQQFWQVMADGGFITDAVAVIDTSRRTGRRVLADAGGVRPRRGRGLKGRCLTFAEREEISVGRAAGESMRSIGVRLGRSASTISRELERNLDGQGRYWARAAHAQAYGRASRPKVAKLVSNLALREKVEHDLEKRYSPEQIVGRLRLEFGDDLEMRVSPETIYQSLYVQSRGALRRELTACLRTGRALRRPSRKVGQRKNRIPNMINVSERPAEVEDRAVPGNWAIGTARHGRLEPGGQALSCAVAGSPTGQAARGLPLYRVGGRRWRVASAITVARVDRRGWPRVAPTDAVGRAFPGQDGSCRAAWASGRRRVVLLRVRLRRRDR